MKTTNIINLMLLLTSIPLLATHLQSTNSDEEQTTRDLKFYKEKHTLIQFLKENYHNPSYKESIKEKHENGVKDLQDLVDCKRTVRDRKFKKTIPSVELFLSQITKFFSDLYAFLSKSKINEQDIENYAPQFAQFTYLYKEDLDEQAIIKKIYAQQQLYNLKLLQRINAIQKNKKNLGSWSRKSRMIPNQQRVANKIVRDILANHIRKTQQ